MDEDADTLVRLSSLLESARGIARELLDDPLLGRLLEVYGRMPATDREVLVGAIEREVRMRVVSQAAAEVLTQVELRPNPKARLYFRVVEPADRTEEVDVTAFMRAGYSVQRTVDVSDPQWRAMVLQALRSIDPDARAKVDQFNATIRALLNEAARLGPLAGPQPHSAAPPPAAPPPAAKDLSSPRK